jgi:G:T/U-mismatch repair DNA glycosylase
MTSQRSSAGIEESPRVFFNGSTAEATYLRHVLPSVEPLGLRYTRLPSTSPAHAALSFEMKLAAWRVVLG